MASTDLSFAVLVAHGAEAALALERAVKSWCDSINATPIVVDTALPLRLADKSGVNDVFEFSGYQLGLERVLDHVGNGVSMLKVVFINDTAVTGHIRWLRRMALMACSDLMFRAGSKSFSFGLAQSCRDPITYIATKGFYFPTFLFGMCGTSVQWQHFRFYDQKWKSSYELNEWFDQLPVEYRTSVNRWLNPTSILHGWYQASPFVVTPVQTVLRKRVSIFLEHSLPDRLTAFQFEPLNLQCVNRKLIWAMRIDRLWGLLRKLTYRLSSLSGKFGVNGRR